MGPDPPVLQRRHVDALHRRWHRPRPGRRDPARDPERTGQYDRLHSAGGALRHARTPRHRHRHRQDYADAKHRPVDDVPDPEPRRRAALGRELRLLQRRRGRPSLHLADQRLQPRRRMEQLAQHVPRRLRRLVVRERGRHAGLGQPAAARRLTTPPRASRAGPRADVDVADEPVADRERRRLHQAGAPHPAHRLRLLRRLDQRLDAPAVHDQQRTAGAGAAAADDRSRGAGLLDQPVTRVEADRHLALQRPVARLRLRERNAGRRQFPSSSTTTPRSRPPIPAARASCRTTGRRSRRTRHGPGSRRWRWRSGTRATTTATTTAFTKRRTKTSCP